MQINETIGGRIEKNADNAPALVTTHISMFYFAEAGGHTRTVACNMRVDEMTHRGQVTGVSYQHKCNQQDGGIIPKGGVDAGRLFFSRR